MSKDTVKRVTLFDSTDLTAAEEYFSQMAQKGLMLKKYGPISHFRRSEPCKLRFSVQVIPAARGENYVKKTSEYVDLCEQAGWTCVSGAAGMYVFATDRSDVPDVVTDPQERIEAVTKQSIGGMIVSFLLSLWLSIKVVGLVSNLIEGKSFASQMAYELPYSLLWLSVFLLFITKTVSFLKWRRNAKRDSAAGRAIRFYGLRASRQRRILLAVFFCLLAVSLGAFIIGLFI